MKMYSVVSTCRSNLSPNKPTNVLLLARAGVKRCYTSKQRTYMSSMTAQSPDEENRFALILGKPGGGKGTISGKILKVGIWNVCRMSIYAQKYNRIHLPAAETRTELSSFTFRRISPNSTIFHPVTCYDITFAKRPR
jgi:hypothetical protein